MKALNIFRFESLKENIMRISKRFPLGVFLVFAITILLFFLTRGNFSVDMENIIGRIIFSIIIWFFLSLWVYLFWETHRYKIDAQWLQLFPFVFWVLFYFSFSVQFDNIDNLIYFILTGVGIIWFLYIAPFFKKILSWQEIKGVYYSYFYNISVVFLISSILGWVLFWLWSIGISAVFALFDINWWYNDIYGDWAIIALACIAPLFWLTQIPEKESFEKQEIVENKFFSFLVKYIATPFIYVYFIILYAYSVKVLLHFWDWPKWEVSWMVIGFSIFGYLIYMFSSYFDEQSGFIKTFRKYFPFVVIPQIAMLFYAIYLRIAQYDITVNRYFVVVFGIWLLVISLYFIFSKKKEIAVIPSVLTLFTIIISLGPWWVYSLPESRQYDRLENNLIQAGILKDGNITPLKTYEDISSELSKEIYEWIDYLCSYNDCQSVKKLFSQIYADFLKRHREEFDTYWESDMKNPDGSKMERVYSPPSNWSVVSDITTQIKVRSYYNSESESEIVYFYWTDTEKIFPVSIEGYRKIYKIALYEKTANVSFTYDLKKKTLELKDGDIQDTIDISPVVDTLSSIYKDTKTATFYKNSAVYELSWEKYSYQLILENINIQNPLYIWEVNIQYGSSNMGWYLLQK